MESNPKQNWHEKAQSLFKRISESTKPNMILLGIGTLLIAIIIFQLGVIVGMRKDSFDHDWHDHNPITEHYPVSHGTAGTIISVNLPTIIVADKDNTERTVVIRDTTIIRSIDGNLKPTDLSPHNFIVAIGTPDPSGELLANFIRVMPPPPTQTIQ